MLAYNPGPSFYRMSQPYNRPVTVAQTKGDEIPILQLKGGMIANQDTSQMSLAQAIRLAKEEKMKPINNNPKINKKEPELMNKMAPKKKKRPNAEVPPTYEEKMMEEETRPKKKIKPAQYLMKIVQSQLEKSHKKQIEKVVPRHKISIDKIEEYMRNAENALGIDLNEMQEADLKEIQKRWGTSVPKLAKSLAFFIIDLVRKQKSVKIKVAPYLMRRFVVATEKELLQLFQDKHPSIEHYQYIASIINQSIKGRIKLKDLSAEAPQDLIFEQPSMVELTKAQELQQASKEN